uniref:Uncharacterized protein n=1 Tax=Timema douglasi TaxID=61478 RepID=A0A7R8ZFC0_TIMDO|nr:unnamed protein product [Timema douglasi]
MHHFPLLFPPYVPYPRHPGSISSVSSEVVTLPNERQPVDPTSSSVLTSRSAPPPSFSSPLPTPPPSQPTTKYIYISFALFAMKQMYRYSSPMASLVLSDSSQLTADGFEKLPDQIMYPYAEPYDLEKLVFSSCHF